MTYIITPEGITVVSNGQSYTLSSTHGNYNDVLDAIRHGEDESTIVELLNPKVALTRYLGDRFEVGENTVKFNGEEVHGTLVRRIIDCHRDGLPTEPLLKFFENLEANPSFRARQELYDFLAHRNMPITPDGCFLAYKSVRSDFTDHHTGKFSNRVGTVLEMERRKVDDDDAFDLADRLLRRKGSESTYEAHENLLLGRGGYHARLRHVQLETRRLRQRQAQHAVDGDAALDSE